MGNGVVSNQEPNKQELLLTYGGFEHRESMKRERYEESIHKHFPQGMHFTRESNHLIGLIFNKESSNNSTPTPKKNKKNKKNKVASSSAVMELDGVLSSSITSTPAITNTDAGNITPGLDSADLVLTIVLVMDSLTSLSISGKKKCCCLFASSFGYEMLLELVEDHLDCNRSVSWDSFFGALGKSVVKSVEESSSEKLVVELTLELNLDIIGLTEITLALPIVSKKTDEGNLSLDIIIGPLFAYFAEEKGRSDLWNDFCDVNGWEKMVIALERDEKCVKDENDDGHSDENMKKTNDEDEDLDEESFLFWEGRNFSVVNFLEKVVKKKIVEEKDLENYENLSNIVKLFYKNREKFSMEEEDKEIMINIMKENKKEVELFLMDTRVKGRIQEEIVHCYENIDDWSFDVLSLTNSHLLIVGYTVLVKHNLLKTFKIKEKDMVAFLQEIQNGYHFDNAYHNSQHAADVTHVLHVLLTRGKLEKKNGIHPHDIFALILSGLIHDVDHPGLNNTYQVNSDSYLAILYNDRSVLENHHCAHAFEIMRSIDILANNDKRTEIRETMISCVLATDMTLHATIFSEFQLRLASGCPFTERTDIKMILQIAIKMADVSNPSRPTLIYLRWCKKLRNELYLQGDKERINGFEISPLMDRNKNSMQNGQIAFINYILHPMFRSISFLLPDLGFVLHYIRLNREYWLKHVDIDESFLSNLQKNASSHVTKNAVISKEINDEKIVKKRKIGKTTESIEKEKAP